MLSGYERVFNQADFERRIRHYFSDSAPCVVRYKLGLDFIEIEDADSGSSVKIPLNASITEEDNVRLVIQAVEDSLYPSLLEVVEEPEPIAPGEVFKRVSKGIPLVEAMSSVRQRTVKKEFRIIRIGLNNNTLVLKQGGAKKVYELLYVPVLKYLEWLREGKLTAKTGYEYLLKNGKEVGRD